MSKVHIILETIAAGGELDRLVINPNPEDERAITAALRELLAGEWLLAVGDTIRIVEVE